MLLHLQQLQQHLQHNLSHVIKSVGDVIDRNYDVMTYISKEDLEL